MEIVASSLTIGLLLYINGMVLDRAHEPMFVAPLAASIVILFIVPGMSWLRSWSVIGGQFLPSAIALGVDFVMPDHDIVVSMIVIALSLIVMRLARCMHPPGVATALLIVAATQPLDVSFLFFPVLFGSSVVVASAWLVYAIERKLPARWGGRIETDPTRLRTSN